MLWTIIRSVHIGNVRAIKIIAGLLGCSLLLQLVTFTTPGWIVYKNPENGYVEYLALMYVVRCDEGGCKANPIPRNEFERDVQFQYVSWILKGLVPILFCSVTMFLLIFSLWKPKWRELFLLICTWSLGMAIVLQWDLMALFADFHRLASSLSELQVYFTVPWNVILHSFSAFLTTTVMLTSLVMLMKKLIVNIVANDGMEEHCMTNPDEA